MEKQQETNNLNQELQYSTGVHWSYGIGGFLTNFTTTALGVRLAFFYMDELGLAILLYTLGQVILALWNMANDPLMGYFSDKKYTFQKKYGRRFPWFLPSSLLCGVFYLFTFLVVGTDDAILFIWLVIMTCAFELTYTTWNTNYIALFPEKFRSDKERTKVAGINTVTGQLGVAFGILLPPLIIEDGILSSYFNAALIIMVINIVFALLMIPGMRENEELRMKQIEVINKQDSGNFFESLKFVFKQKNMAIYLYAYLAHQVLTFVMLAMLPYWTNYVVDAGDADTAELVLAAAFLLGGMVSVPFWIKIGRSIGNRKGLIYGMFATSIIFIPMLFISDLLLNALNIGILGFGIGAMWTLMYPGFSDVIDENILLTNRRNEGTYNGVRMFIGRFGSVLQAVAMGSIFIITNYQQGVAVQPASAIIGFRILMVFIPMIFYLTAALLIWKFSDLTKEKVAKLKQDLEKKGF